MKSSAHTPGYIVRLMGVAALAAEEGRVTAPAYVKSAARMDTLMMYIVAFEKDITQFEMSWENEAVVV